MKKLVGCSGNWESVIGNWRKVTYFFSKILLDTANC